MAEARGEAEIRAESERERAEYHELADSLTPAQIRERTGRIKALAGELSDCIAAGAEPCPRCGAAPHGMLKTPALVGGGAAAGSPNSRLTQPVYEIGCLPCGPEDGPETGGLITRTEPRVQAASPRSAVLLWNAGERITKQIHAVG